MNYKKITTITFAAMLCACCTNQPAVTIKKEKPPIEENVGPVIGKIDDNNIGLRKKIDEQNQTIKLQKADIDRAIAIADRLRKQLKEAIPIEDIDVLSLQESLESAKARNLFLENQNKEASEKIAEQDKLIKEANAKNAKERARWEEIVDTLEKQIEALTSKLTKTEKEKDKAVKSAAANAVYRNWAIGLAVVVVLWILLKVAISIYFPAANIRKII